MLAVSYPGRTSLMLREDTIWPSLMYAWPSANRSRSINQGGARHTDKSELQWSTQDESSDEERTSIRKSMVKVISVTTTTSTRTFIWLEISTPSLAFFTRKSFSWLSRR